MKNPTRLIGEAKRQNVISLAYRCIQETQKKVDDELKSEITHMASQSDFAFSSVAKKVKAARYAKLESYLQNGRWENADEETYRLMITEVGKDKGQ